MNTSITNFVKLLVLLPLMSHSLVQAATPFVPDNFYSPGYIGSPAASGFVLRANRVLYAIDYNSQDWSGNLHAYAIGTNGTVSTTDNWSTTAGSITKFGAAPKIDAQNFKTGRNIVTLKSDGSKIPFVWGDLSTTQQNSLDPGTATGALSSPVLDYIRGDRQNEEPLGQAYAARTSVLGDIIHSTPKYWDDGINKTVYVGANDGMLHAINADTGVERFAYIPSMLIPKLKALTDPAYTHKYYVDGNLATGSFASSGVVTSILAGGLGGGGKGIFALNITAVPTTEANASAKIMWEITNTTTGFANLGDTYGKPVFATLQDGTKALIMANGYNNTGNGHSSLYVINPLTGAKIAEMDAGTGTVTAPNGLSSPTLIDSNFDGKIDFAYAGDIDGNLWKFDLSTTTSRAGAATLLHTTSQAQAITMAPGYTAHPDGGYMVTFVTGKIFTTADEDDTATHYAYGIWDRPTAFAGNADILTQTLTEKDYTYTDAAGVSQTIKVRIATKNQPNWAATATGEPTGTKHHKGWQTALPLGGERVVGDGAYVADTVFIFLSANPKADPSLLPPGQNWMTQLNPMTGGSNADVRFDLNGNAIYGTDDKVSVTINSATTMEIPVARHIGGGVRSQLIAFATNNNDIYIANYDKNGDPVTTPPLAPPTSTTATATTVPPTTTVLVPASTNTTTSTFISASSSVGTNTTVAPTTTTSTSIIQNVVGVAGGHFDEDIYYGASLTGTATKGVTTYSKSLHNHEYDDIYDKTGVNMLHASNSGFDLKNAIDPTLADSASTTQFKVIASNQYLNPAVSIHFNGSPSYVYNINQGYVALKDYTTSATLNVSTLPSYTRASVNSLAINMPTDAFAQKDWWGGVLGLPADVRVGLHPTQTGCVNKSAGGTDGNMYQPVNPPLTVTAAGNGTSLGYSGTTTALTATGVRHNGALTIQVIRAATPQSALELSIPNHPEYGWRVKSANYATYVLAEYTTFWHHPNGKCYGTAGWTKLAPQDPASSAASGTPATGSSDPKIGGFLASSGGAVTPTPPPTLGTTTNTTTNVATGTTTTTSVTTVKNADGTYTSTTNVTVAPIVQNTGTTTTSVTNPNGTVTTTTTNVVKNTNGSYTTTKDIATSGVGGTPPPLGTTTSNVTNADGSITTTTINTVKNTDGSYTSTTTVSTPAYNKVVANNTATVAELDKLAAARIIAAAGPAGVSTTESNVGGSGSGSSATCPSGSTVVTNKVATLNPNGSGSYDVVTTVTTTSNCTNTTSTATFCTGVSAGGAFITGSIECQKKNDTITTPKGAIQRVNWRELMVNQQTTRT